jgi:hypothetical protein
VIRTLGFRRVSQCTRPTICQPARVAAITRTAGHTGGAGNGRFITLHNAPMPRPTATARAYSLTVYARNDRRTSRPAIAAHQERGMTPGCTRHGQGPKR